MGSPELKTAEEDPKSDPMMQLSISTTNTNTHSPPPQPSKLKWLLVGLSIFFLLAGQSVGTFLGRFYYDEGGNSKWMQTFLISVGFPILYLPLLFSPPPTPPITPPTPHPSLIKTGFIYVFLGLMIAGNGWLYSYGLFCLPISTYSLVCATQLGFNAVFSYFINSERFTHLTLNSVVLLTLSAAILGVHADSGELTGVSKAKYVIGFILTLTASATFSLILSLTELTFRKVLKSESFSVVLDMLIYTGLVATCAAAVGIFASGEWRGLKGEMEGFKKGRVSYVMTLVWTAVSWQVSGVGVVGLIFEVSSLFSNVISTLGIPIAPIFAVILFQDKMDGMKVMSFLLAMWGFVSYFYQQYLDYKSEKETKNMQVGTKGAS